MRSARSQQRSRRRVRPRQWLPISPIDLAVVTLMLLTLLPWDLYLDSKISLTQALASPSWHHPLGTDNLGRDLLLRLISCIHDAVVPLWAAVVIGCFCGWILGFLALHCETSKIGRRSFRLVKLAAMGCAGIPLGIAVFLWAALQEKAGLFPVISAIAVLIAVRCYLQCYELFAHDRELGYWQSHQALGGSATARIGSYGFLSNWRQQLSETLVHSLRVGVTIEVSLSYLGFGIQEPQASLGNILASHLDQSLKGNWLIVIAIVGVFFVVAAFPISIYRLVRLCFSKQMSTPFELSIPQLSGEKPRVYPHS